MRASHSGESIATKSLATFANAKLASFCSLALANSPNLTALYPAHVARVLEPREALHHV